jgi:PPK2 family polyphosphate:nucleotide phosphotransferase
MGKLTSLPTKAPKDLDEDKVKKKTLKLSLEITKLLHNMSVQKKHSIILVLQGMDASGKDGVVKSVFFEMANSIYNVVAFKKPTEEEMAHDFLWRIHKNTPAKGRLVIFNRSHYEDVLIQRVHKWVTEETVANRMNAINSFEENLLKDNGTIMVKCYLHISPEKQLEKLKERMEDPYKQWKHNPHDFEERKYWDRYMECYEDAIKKSKIPWHIIPSDNRWYRNYCVAKIFYDTLVKLEIPDPVIVKPK